MNHALSFWQRVAATISLRPRRQLKELYLFSLLFSFAFSLIIIFEPVFFYQQGFTLSTIALYYALHYTIYVFLLPLGARFAARFGYERSLALSTPLFIIYFICLALLPTYSQLFWSALVLLTLHKIFYWPAYHADFATYTDHTNRGTEQSWVRVITYGAGIIGPLLGGFVAQFFGFSTLFILAAATVLAAGIPLLATRERSQHVRIPYATAWHIIRRGEHRRMTTAMLGWAEDSIFLIFWPIWLFIILGSTQQLGIVAAISILVMTVFSFTIGEFIDRHTPRRVLRVGALLVVASNLVRIGAGTPWRVFAADVGVRTATITKDMSFIAQLYMNAKKHGALKYALAFETMLAVAKATLLWLLIGLFATLPLPTAFTATWLIGAALALLYAVL